MNEGAFAILDCLGFKGAWARGADPKDIIGFLQSSKKEIENSPILKSINIALPGRLRFSTAFISDTAVLAVHPTGTAPLAPTEKGYLISLLVPLCILIVERFLHAPIPFTIRGCLTYGDFLVEDSFFLGQAVDEAAAFSETSDGAFVWLTPRAQEHLRAYNQNMSQTCRQNLTRLTDEQHAVVLDRILNAVRVSNASALIPEELKDLSKIDVHRRAKWGRLVLRWIADGVRSDLTIPYHMPLTTGGSLNVSVLSPYAPYSSIDPDPILPKYLQSFGDPRELRVLVKRQNTLLFLETARAYAADAITRTMGVIRSAEREELGAQVLTDPEVHQFLRYGKRLHS